MVDDELGSIALVGLADGARRNWIDGHSINNRPEHQDRSGDFLGVYNQMLETVLTMVGQNI